MSDTQVSKRPIGLAIFFIVAGVIGWLAAFALTVEKFTALTNPSESLSCDFNPVVQCTKNLDSWQGSLFGFPNPIIGLAAWIAPIVVGAALLAGARFQRWFWITFNLGVLGAFVFIIWLSSQSVFVLGTLCIYCMITWAVTIPLFWALSLYNLRNGTWGGGDRLRRIAGALYGWVPAISLACYLVIAVLAQVRLDFLSSF